MGGIGITEPAPIRRDYWSTKTRRIEPGGLEIGRSGTHKFDVPDIAQHVYGAQIVLRPIAIMQDTQKDQSERGKADEVSSEPFHIFVNADRLRSYDSLQQNARSSNDQS